MTAKLQVCCEAFMEASWLAAAVTIPLFFNISSAQTFEPDKMFVLRCISVLALAAFLAKRIHTAKDGQKSSAEGPVKHLLLAHPLAILVLSLGAIYALSSFFSVAPALSWRGSYTRAQGTIAFFCYVILFFVVTGELRTWAQWMRLQFSIIIASLPVGIYAILQHFNSDPLRWFNPIAGRPAASMGNPIFLGAYLVMVIPLTFSRVVDAAHMIREKSGRKPGLVLLCCCGAILALQVFALLSTQSRGPAIGLAAAVYICLFILLVMKRNPEKQSFRDWAAAAVLGFIVPLLLIAVARLTSGFPAGIGSACFFVAIIAVAAVYFLMWRARRGRNLLWLAWLAQTLTLACFFFIGPSRLLGEGVRVFTALGRLVQLSDASAGARMFLWQSGWNAMQSAPPAALDGGRQDAFHALRRAIGYGPECIWFAANAHAVPELVKLHTRETVDRMHNDVLDNLVSIGFAGAAASLLLFAAAVFYSLRYLGFHCEGRRKTLFCVLAAAGGAAGVLIPCAAGSPHLSGVGVQAGLLAGIFVFVAWSGFHSLRADLSGGHKALVLCILAVLIAHFVETGVGIAVTPTRVYFFLLLSVLCVLSAGDFKQEEEPAKRRASKPQVREWNPLLPWAAIASFVLLAEAWCFVINTGDERSALSLFLRIWFTRPAGQGFLLPGTLILLVLTFSGSVALMYAEKPNLRALKIDFRKAAAPCILIMAAVWLVMGLLSSYFWTALGPGAGSPVDVSLHAEARMTLFISALLLLLIAAALVLATADAPRYAAAASIGRRALWPGLLLAACACAAIVELTLRPAWADIARRIARMYEDSGRVSASIQVYERAAELAPRVTSYQTSLGSVQVSAFRSESDQARRESLLAAAAQSYQRALDLNPLDPAGQRAMGSFYVQTGEIMSDPAARDSWIRKAFPFLQQAVRLAPNYPDGYIQLGHCHFLLGENERAGELYRQALQMSPRFARIHMFMGEMYYRQNDLDQALRSFTEASRLNPGNLEARKNIGMVLTRLGRKQEAIGVYTEALKRAPKDYLLLRRLASLYFSLDDYGAGIDFARRAYEARPPAGKGSFDDFVRELQSQYK